VAGVLKQDLSERDQLVIVDGAARFAVGDPVLLADEDGTIERAEVANVRFDTLAFRSLDDPEGKLRNAFLASRAARVLAVREVAFSLKEDATGVRVLARKATGQAEQTLARYVGVLHFAYLDEEGGEMDPSLIANGALVSAAPRAVRITLRLLPNPSLPRVTVPPLTLRVPLEPQSATIAFDTFAFHRVGVAAVIGRDPVSAERKAGVLGWRKSEPLL
jgi:hypothetical protein